MASFFDSDSEEEDVIICASIIALTSCLDNRIFDPESTPQREHEGAYAMLKRELSGPDQRANKTCVRMNIDSFNNLLQLVGPRMRRKVTVMRRAVPPEERLAVTLRYLGSGDPFSDLAYMFRIPACMIRNIVLETCDALYDAIKAKFLKMPTTQEEWLQIASEFGSRWDLPNCIGALDGKHVEIRASGDSDSEYFNYLNYHSIIIVALVDAKYRFLFIDVGRNGNAGNIGVFEETRLMEALEDKTINVPGEKTLPGTDIAVPLFMVGDDAFPLDTYLMKPYPFRTVAVADQGDEETEEEERKRRIFGFRLARARRISENAFGILADRFGVFQTCIQLSPSNATRVTLAAIAIYNFLMTKQDQEFAPPSLYDRERPFSHEVMPGEWRENKQQFDDLEHVYTDFSDEATERVRGLIKDYVNGPGQVPWQRRLVFGSSD